MTASDSALRLELARQALIGTGYFTDEEVGDDIAPRIIDLWSRMQSARDIEPIPRFPRDPDLNGPNSA